MNDLYTILINVDHSFIHTNKKRILYRSKNIDTLRFIVNPMYNDLDMRKVNVALQYVTPANRKYGVVVLKPEEELYHGKVQYLLPIDLRFTSEIGNLELTINFSYVSILEDGTFKEQVRPIGYTSLLIEDTVRWDDYIPEADLSNIAQIMLNTQSMLEQQKEYAEMLKYEKADGIAKDEDTNEIYLTANGVRLNTSVIDEDTCMSEDGVPVVEFGENSGSENPGQPDLPDDVYEDNVIEF